MKGKALSDIIDNVFSSIYHLNELHLLNYSTWANLKETVEISIEEELDKYRKESSSLQTTIAKCDQLLTKNQVILNDDGSIVYFVNDKKFIKDKQGKVYLYDNEKYDLIDTELPELTNVVFIEGNTIKAICDNGIYLYVENHWELVRTIETPTLNLISMKGFKLTTIRVNSEDDDYKYEYYPYDKKLEIYLRKDYTEPCTIIENVDTFVHNENGAAYYIKNNFLYVKLASYTNPTNFTLISDPSFNYCKIKHTYLASNNFIYITVVNENNNQYVIYYIDLTDNTFLDKGIAHVNTDINANTELNYIETKKDYLNIYFTNTDGYVQDFVIDTHVYPFFITVSEKNASKYGIDLSKY